MSKDKEKKHMSTSPDTLIEIDDPTFGKGYQEGRQRYFLEPSVFTDEEVVTRLVQAFESSQNEHKARAERKEHFASLVGQIVGEMSGCVLPRQSYEGGMPTLLPEPKWFPTPQTLVVISHPIFNNAYLDGRLSYFQEHRLLNDYQLMTRLSSAFRSSQYESAKEWEREAMLYDWVGHLVGEMSAGVLPRQPLEEQRYALQVACTTKAIDIEKERRRVLKETLSEFWVVQDRLAHLLDAELFEEVMTCCVQKRNPASTET
jgi:hypothetical protein